MIKKSLKKIKFLVKIKKHIKYVENLERIKSFLLKTIWNQMRILIQRNMIYY